MTRFVLITALLLAVPVLAQPPSTRIITTREGKVFYDCRVSQIFPDAISFTHRDGVARVALKELPDGLRQEFRHDPAQAAARARVEEARKKEEKERAERHEQMMAQKLKAAQEEEARHLAAARALDRGATPPVMSVALPGEIAAPQTTAAWVGSPISGPAVGGRDYRRGGFSYWGAQPFVNPYSGYGTGFFPWAGGWNPYGGVTGWCSPAVPLIYRSWNVGNGFRVGVGVSPFFGSGLRLFP